MEKFNPFETVCPETKKLTTLIVLKESEDGIRLLCPECGKIIEREIGYFANLFDYNPSKR